MRICLSCLTWLLSLLTISAASAQTFLEKIETQVRKDLTAPSIVAPKSGGASDASPQSPSPLPPPAPAPRGVTGTETPGLERGYLGVITDDRQDRGRGVRILEVRPQSPGQQAGLRPRDLITGAAGIRVRQMSELASIFDQVPVGGKLALDILRGEQPMVIQATFGRRPDTPPARPSPPSAPPGLAPVPSGMSPPPSMPAIPDSSAGSQPPTVTPTKPAEGGPADRSRIEILERRVRELEERLQQLERKLSQNGQSAGA